MACKHASLISEVIIKLPSLLNASPQALLIADPYRELPPLSLVLLSLGTASSSMFGFESLSMQLAVDVIAVGALPSQHPTIKQRTTKLAGYSQPMLHLGV